MVKTIWSNDKLKVCKCKNCNALLTYENEDIIKKNRFLLPKYEKATYLEEAERLAFKEYYENRKGYCK